MKINSLSLISIVSVLTCVSAANAAVMADFYIGGMAGVGGSTMFTDGKHDTASSQMFGAVAGMDLPIFRIEGEYDYLHSTDYKTHAGMLNLYAKMPSTVIQPYIGAGAGLMFGGDHTVDSTKYDIKSTGAYQAMLGATIDILKLPLKFDIEGRVLYAPDIYKIEGKNIEPDMLQYNIRAKVRFIF
jgi:hypothetical protein